MDRGLRQMLWMSWTLRSQTLCLSSPIPNRVIQSISQNYWTTSKDIHWSDKLEPLKRIMQEPNTHSSQDFLHTLKSINKKHPKMDAKDTLDVLTALVKITKEDKCQIDFLNHEGFQSLCEQLRRQIRLMSLNEIVDCMKLLTFLKVPASTLLMNNLLQAVRNSINELQIDQAHLILSLLDKMERTPLSSALLIALPVVLPTIINTKLDYDDLHELSIALYRIKDLDKHGMFVKILISIQLVMKERPNSASIHVVKNIFRSLCAVPSSKYSSAIYLDTVKLCNKTLFYKAHNLNGGDILECVHSISSAVTNGNIAPYDNNLLNTLLEVGISKNVQFYIGYRTLHYLNNMRHVYVPFLEYLLNKILNENKKNFNINTLLNAFCLTNYKSVPWTYIENIVLQNEYLSDCSAGNLIECVMCLAALDKYYPQLLSTVFIKTDMKMLKSFEKNARHCARFISLYQNVKTFYPEYKGPWPSKETLNYASKMAYFPHVSKDKFKNCLQTAMGGPEYILTNLKTQIGHNIDYAVIMQKGEYPVAFNTQNSKVLANYSNFVEELQCPPECDVILIIAFLRTAYSINTLRLTNIHELLLKSLEKWTGHKCIGINLDIWENLPIHEKTSYFMQRIKNISDDVVTTM